MSYSLCARSIKVKSNDQDLLHAVDELLQVIAESQRSGTRRQLAEVYDERAIERLTNEATAHARSMRARAEDRGKKARDAQRARAAQARRKT